MFKNSNKKKKEFIGHIFKNFKREKNILSATIVGSFADSNNITKINDTDLIVIVKKLNERSFEKIKKLLIKLKLEKFYNNKKIIINDTFGPLKFNTDKFSVIHLMVYDLKGHIEHAIKSPFTVYDWERSKIFLNQNLSSIYSVGNIQLLDFLNHHYHCRA